MKKILLLDNYDSFTYNLLHYVEQYDGTEADVFRNDEITVEEAGNYDAFLLSPGPGLPSESGILLPLIKKYSSTHPILGVCLGLQAIAEVFGGKLKQLAQVSHGVARDTFITDAGEKLFENIPSPFPSGRYHSWVVDEKYVPKDFFVTAVDGQENIMAMSHKNLPVKGVQFHPESVMTPSGKQMIFNWLSSL